MDEGMKPVRGINHSLRVYPGLEISERGFGQNELTSQAGAGMLFSEVRPWAFQMRCSCQVTRVEECGGVCRACREELEKEQEKLGCGERLSPEQVDWASTPCARHWLRCRYPFCAELPWGCDRHVALAPDGLTYCPAHYKEVVGGMELAVVEEAHGKAASKVLEYFRGLFFDK